MNRTELNELCYIVPIASVPSIMEGGILSHRRAEGVRHQTVALQEVQDRRANVVVPMGRPLHEYANLYVCARNPMLLKRSDMHREICVLRVDANVIDLPNVVITNSNAASRYARFMPAPAGLAIIDRDRTFATWWTHEDQIEQWRHSAQKCAEVLIPDRVPADFVVGAYVSCEHSKTALEQLAPALPVVIDASMFFQ